MKHWVRFLVLLLLATTSLYGQYYGERVLEKSFEQTDFFFAPNFLNPYGFKGFSTAVPGVLDDPLLNLQVNPAHFYSDSLRPNYVYVDFRSTRDIIDDNHYYGYIMPADVRMDVYSPSSVRYPFFYANSRKSLDPILSVALLTRPLSQDMPDLFLGVTHQVIFQDEKYYSIPQDIYKSTMGYDYAGARVTEAGSVPVVDRHSGTDNMHHTGLFTSFFAGYNLSSDVQVGVRINRATFDRNGAFGSKNFYEYAYSPNGASTWYDMEARSQNYGHWDFNGGIRYKLTEYAIAGITAGYLNGDVNQELTRLDTSLYTNGQVNVSTSWGFNRRFASTLQTWNHRGKTRYGSIQLQTNPTSSRTMIFVYNFARQNIDMILGSNVIDSSTYSYRSQWDTSFYRSDSRYFLSDLRNGYGNTMGTTQRLLAAWQWKLDDRKDLSFGVSYEWKTTETNTNEAVVASRNSMYSWTSNNSSDNYFHSADEAKNLLWTFKTSLTTIQIPVIFTFRSSETAELLIGLNRRISRWKIEDVTLALFQYRNQSSTSGSTNKANFGERYTSPTETISDISTTFIAGFTISPSKLFSARVLVTPTLQEQPYGGPTKIEFQWWIGISLFP